MSKVLKYVASVALLFICLAAFAQDKTLEYYNTHQSEILPDAQEAFRNGSYDRAVKLCIWHYIMVGDNRADELREKALQAYYNTHESEILPDAQKAFRDGNYERAVELCKWHYVIVGDDRADALRDKALRCAELTTEMNAFASDRRLDKAREKANEVLALNPDDKAAQDMSIIPTKGEINGHEWVDLGLPSGLKWATCNVGASSAIEPGDYFAWGETSSKSEYKWRDYRFRTRGNDSDNVRLSKYNTEAKRGDVDDKTCLDLSDDAARANWGGSWRMPTKDEVVELLRCCTWTWTSQEGRQGYLVKGKNGNSIFLPVTGSKSSLNIPHFGYFWTSSLYNNPSEGYGLHYYQADYSLTTGPRYAGLPVRPVTE